MQKNHECKIRRVKIIDLKEHPRQREFFSKPSDEEIKELAADVQTNGLLDAIEILPDNTLICGHKRVKAAKVLGWNEIDAWIREDLEAQGADAIERRLIEDNLNRRQLERLDIARCALRLKHLAKKNRRSGLSDREDGELRDHIGKRLGLSGRHVDRLLRVVEQTPPAVQHAVSAKKLSIILAEKVAGLEESARQQVAQEIEDGGQPKEIIRKLVGKPEQRHKPAYDAKAAFLKSLERGLADLDGRVANIRLLKPAEVQTLNKAGAVIRQLLDQAEPPGDVTELCEKVTEVQAGAESTHD